MAPAREENSVPVPAAEPGDGVFRVVVVVSAPRLIKKVQSEDSRKAHRAKIEGTVFLAIEVWEDGRAHNVRVVHSLDEKDMEAVRQ